MTDCNETHANRPKIDLYLNQAGVIILFKSGVIYQNQTCNTACMQRCEEGILLLVCYAYLVAALPEPLYLCPIESGLKKMEWGPVEGIDEKRASEIDDLLQSESPTKHITVDRSRLNESEEAWVYVTLEPGEYGFYQGFGSCKGVLVWGNSD